MKGIMSGVDPASVSKGMKKQENHKNHFSRDVMLGSDLWTDGLICAFEFIRGHRKTRSVQDMAKKQVSSSELNSRLPPKGSGENFCKSAAQLDSGIGDSDMVDDHTDSKDYQSGCYRGKEEFPRSYWIPIGWARISELVQNVQVDVAWALQPINFSDDEDDVTVADVAAPYWERPVGRTWWCHVDAGHPNISAWLSNAQWLHPAISIALRDESKLISERMKHLLYEVNYFFYICLAETEKEKKK